MRIYFELKIQMGKVGQVETKTTESKLELKVSLVVIKENIIGC